jgi:cell division protein FtsL
VRPAQAESGLVVGALAALRSVEGHPLLDRVIRGRAWIGIVAFALIGIVTLQLGLLELNAGIGRTLAQEQSLQREDAALSIENSELAAGNRVEASAAHLGMQIVPISSLKSLTPDLGGGDVAHVASMLSTPIHTASSVTSEADAGSSPTTSEQTASEQQASEASPASTAESSTAETSATAAVTTSESSATSSAPPAVAPTPTPATTPQAPEPDSATPSASSEATPAGGTQAGPTG